MALEYYITDGKKFVRQDINGQYKITSNCTIADTWDNPSTANAILNNSLSCALRKGLFVAKYEDGEFVKCSKSIMEKETINKQHKAPDGYTLDLYSFDDDCELQELIKGFEDVYNTLKNTKELHFKLQNKYSTADMIREDLKHYRLRKRMGTVDSYKFKKLGDKVLLKRLSIKNRLEILYKINEYRKELEKSMGDICKVIDSVRNKKYTPRVLDDLFENDNLDVEIAL